MDNQGLTLHDTPTTILEQAQPVILNVIIKSDVSLQVFLYDETLTRSWRDSDKTILHGKVSAIFHNLVIQKVCSQVIPLMGRGV